MHHQPMYSMNPAHGVRSMGTIAMTKNGGHHSNIPLLPPNYAGKVWDNITPWDTKSEQAEKEEAKAAQDAAYQERMDDILANQQQATGPSVLTYALVGVFFAGTIFLLSRR